MRIQSKTGNQLEAQENIIDQIEIALSLVFDWLKWWGESSQSNLGSLSILS